MLITHYLSPSLAQVNVFRLVTTGSIEEHILGVACEKKGVADLSITGACCL